TLEVGGTWTYTYLYTVTQADLDSNSKLFWQPGGISGQYPSGTNVGFVNGAHFESGTDKPATGTGLVQSFVRIQNHPATTNTEQGYNTDFRPYDAANDAGNVHNFNHSLLISDIPKVTINGVQYWEFHLDLNDSNNADSPIINLLDLQLIAGDSGSLHGFNATTGQFSSNDPTLE